MPLAEEDEEEECSEMLTIIVKTMRSPDAFSALLAAIPVEHLHSPVKL
jgi:hypothetical protein